MLSANLGEGVDMPVRRGNILPSISFIHQSAEIRSILFNQILQRNEKSLCAVLIQIGHA